MTELLHTGSLNNDLPRSDFRINAGVFNSRETYWTGPSLPLGFSDLMVAGFAHAPEVVIPGTSTATVCKEIKESDHWTSYSWANSVPIELYRCHGIPPGDDRFGGSQQLRLHALGPCWGACRQGYRPDYQDWSHSILSRSALSFDFHLHRFLLKYLVIPCSWTYQVTLRRN